MGTTMTPIKTHYTYHVVLNSTCTFVGHFGKNPINNLQQESVRAQQTMCVQSGCVGVQNDSEMYPNKQPNCMSWKWIKGSGLTGIMKQGTYNRALRVIGLPLDR